MLSDELLRMLWFHPPPRFRLWDWSSTTARPFGSPDWARVPEVLAPSTDRVSRACVSVPTRTAKKQWLGP